MERNLAEIVARFYRASLASGDWSEALAAVREAAEADVCGLLVHDVGENEGRFLHAVGLGAAARTAYAAGFAASNPYLQDPRLLHEAPAVFDARELIAVSDLRTTDFYALWLKPLELLDQLFVVLSRRGDRVRLLWVARAEHNGPFATEETEFMKHLSAHLAYADAAGEGIQAHSRAHRTPIDVLETMPIGVATLNGHGGVIRANRLARNVIEAAEGIYPANGGLALDFSGRRVKLRDLIAQINGPAKPLKDNTLPLSVPRHSGLRPLTLLLVAAGGDEEDDDAPAAILYVSDPDHHTSFDHERIGKLYGLSRAESRVAALLASGYRLEQAAETLGVAYETVRKHLKQIFSKTGTFRQAELVRILVTGPANLNL
jgi:DNA-binding CsgD family transcriptional regulator